MTIIPTIFAHNKKEFISRFKKIIPVAKNIQIDFMDGKFVKSKSVSLKEIPDLKKYKNNFEAHLMCFNPEKYIQALKKKGFKKIIFHYESTNSQEKIIAAIKKKKIQVYIAVNPETPVEKIFPYLEITSGILFMGVHPGKEHQNFISAVYKKIFQLRKINKKIKIQIDGGVNTKTASRLAKLGVNNINSGSFISESKKPREEFKKLNLAFKK